MRHVIVTLILLGVFNVLAQAQTEKGRWTVGAQVGDFSYSNNGDSFSNRSFSMSLSPSAGYFVAKNLVIGASVPISYVWSSNNFSNNGRAESNIYSIGLSPFVRYYVGAAKLRPFVSASVGFQQYWATTRVAGNVNTQRDSFNMTSYALGGGVAYFINNTVSLDASLNYTNGIGNSGFRQRGRANLNIGFRLFFGK